MKTSRKIYSLMVLLLLMAIGVKAQDSNKLYIPDTRIGVGEKADLPVYVQNTSKIITGIQFTIKVEEGVTVDINNATKTGRLDYHKMKVASKGDNTYTVMIYSSDNAVLTGSDGIVVKLPVYIADTVKVGATKSIELSKVVLSDNVGKNVLTSSSAGIIKTIKFPQLTLTAAKQEVKEGDKILFTITNEDAPSTPLDISISSDMPGRLKYPASVTMGANSTSVTFEVEALDNGEVSDTLTTSVKVSATGHKDGECLLMIIDDDMPEIDMELKPTIVSEGAGMSAIVGKIIRRTKTENKITIVLSDDSNGQIYHDKELVMRAGETEVEFTIGVVDNAVIDEDRLYNITAAVYMPSCNCSAKGTSIGSVTRSITVTDDDGPTLKISSSSTSVKEGSKITFTITQNVNTDKDITVELSSDKDDAFEYDHSIVIPAGEKSVQITVTAKENDVIEGNRSVVFIVKREGYATGTCWIQLTDQTIPDVSITNIEVTPAKIEVGQKATINVTLKNIGNAHLPSLTRVNFYISNKKNELGHAFTADTVSVGGELTLSHELEMPNSPGSFNLWAVANEDKSIKELTYSNNSSNKLSVTLLPAFTATATTDKAIYTSGECVTISGKATGSKAKNMDLEVYYINEGIRQTITTKTDDEGNYSAIYELPQTTSGHFIVGACYPNENLKTEMASFDVYGLRLSACSNNIEFDLGETYQGTMTITNAVNLKQTGLKVSQGKTPDDCVFAFTIPETIEGNEIIKLNFTITPSVVSTDRTWHKMPITITSAEGASTDYCINYYINSQLPLLSANVSSINTTMTKGAKRDYPITITNKGKGETGKITLALPEWIKTSTPQEMASLAQGESATIVLQLEPTEDMQLNVPVNGKLAINCENGSGIPISFSITPVSESEGKLIVDVVDEFTFETQEAPHVCNAKVIIKRPNTGELIAQGLSSAEGLFSVTVPEGQYEVSVTANNHEQYTNQVMVDAGKDNNHEAFISYDAVTYSWDVVETEIEDSYEIETIVKYDTRVPKPVILISLPHERPEDGSIIPIVVTNKGFINAEDVNVSLAISGDYNIEFLTEPYLAKLAANQSEVFYAKLNYIGGANAREKVPSLSECLSLQAKLRAHYICGNKYDNTVTADDLRRWGQCLNIASNIRYSYGGYVGGGGSGPGGYGLGGYGSGWWQIVPIPTKVCKPGNNNDPSGNNPSGLPDIVPENKPEKGDCKEKPVLNYKLVPNEGKRYDMLGVAADGVSKLKIVFGEGCKIPDCDEWKCFWTLENDNGKIGTLDNVHSWENVIYTVPEDFPSDVGYEYPIKAKITYTNGKESHEKYVDIIISRVPVVFVHGLNSNPGNWTKMINYFVKSKKYNLYQLEAADYERSHNDSFEKNKDIVGKTAKSLLIKMLSTGLLAKKVDVIGHSMGGLLTKKWVQNNGGELFHKIITINTPHGGSQLGNFVISPAAQYVLKVKDLFVERTILGKKKLQSITPYHFIRKQLRDKYKEFLPNDGQIETGAVADLSVNGSAINQINNNNTNGIKCHAIVTISSAEASLLTNPVAKSFGYEKFSLFKDALFDKDDCDLVVPVKSQEGGLEKKNTTTIKGYKGTIHIFTCDDSSVQKHALNLLSESINSTSFSNGFNYTGSMKYDKTISSNVKSIYNENNSDLSDVQTLIPQFTRKRSSMTEESLVSYLTMDSNYTAGDSQIKIRINKEGDFSKVSFGCYYNDELLDYIEADDATISLPQKVKGDLVVMYEGECSDGSWFSASDTIAINTIGTSRLDKIQFEEDSLIIVNDNYKSPKVLCIWDDGTSTDAISPHFVVDDAKIATIDEDKYVYGLKSGKTKLLASYNGFECSIPLTIINNSEENPTNEASNSVCSTITLSFKQEMVMTRQAFRGTLTVNNGDAANEMKDVKLNLEVKDEDGNVATSHEFQINAESLEGFQGKLDLTSGWTLDAKGTGIANILFIPTKYAAPTEPKKWSFGGTFSYIDPSTGLAVTKELYPVTLTVKPSPNLVMDYFMQRDVLGDDALTEDIVEPMVPAEFSLLINNKGYGDATNVKMVTNQPEIIDNEKGLLINFEILSSQLNGGEKTLALGQSVATDFGTIPAGKTSYAQWWFTSSLLGHFTEYDVKATHLTSYGNPDLTLLDTVAVHELIHTLTIPKSESMRGFLVNDVKDSKDLPDMLYLTDGTIKAVAQASGTLTANGNNIYTLTAEPTAAGWNYGNLVDPTNGHKMLSSVTRNSDGASISIDNFWQTSCTLRDNKDPLYEFRLHFADDMAATGETYTLTFIDKPMTILDVDTIVGASEKDGYIETPVERLTVHFNKDIATSTFTIDDLTLTLAGKNLDAKEIVITKVNEKQFDLNIKKLTEKNGYYVLTVQTADIKDTEGFPGEVGRKISWTQLKGGKLTSNLDYNAKKGWNWISSNLEEGSKADAKTFLDPIKDNLLRFVGFENELTNDPVYGLFGNLETINPTDGYKLQVNDTVKFRHTGQAVDPEELSMSLLQGWNWIGYLPIASLNVSEALAKLSAEENDILKAQDAFVTFADGKWIGTLTEMKPGEGYLYYSNSVKSFNYPKVFPSNVASSRKMTAKEQPYNPWQYDVHRYADNTTMIGRLYFNNIPDDDGDYTIGAFYNNECRGVGRNINGMVFITIHGSISDSQDITFRAYDNKTGLEFPIIESIEFKGQNIGTPSMPMALHSNGTTRISAVAAGFNISPRPMKSRLYISGATEEINNIQILATNGKKVVDANGYESAGIDVSMLLPGLYIVSITTNDGNVYYDKVFKDKQ